MPRSSSLSLVIAALALIAGCASSVPRQPAVVYQSDYGGAPPNLLLGRSSAETEVASLFAGRSDWPSAPHGYRLEDITYYDRSDYDYQNGFNRYGGMYYSTQTYQTGVWLRR